MEISGILFYIIIFIIILKAKNNSNQRKPSGSGKQNAGKNTAGVNQGKKISKNCQFEIQKQEKRAGESEKKTSRQWNASADKRKQTNRTELLWREDKYAAERVVALRLMEGDPVPQGWLKVKCPYCGADNLVKTNSRQHHSCYFCRVPIDE